jgi:hypothetical protein
LASACFSPWRWPWRRTCQSSLGIRRIAQAADDALPIAAYALKHLSDEQRRAIFEAVGNEGRQSATPDADYAQVGAQVPTAVALAGLSALPEQITSSIPEMSDVMFTRAADKIVLINPRTRVVIGVVER